METCYLKRPCDNECKTASKTDFNSDYISQRGKCRIKNVTFERQIGSNEVNLLLCWITTRGKRTAE